MLECIAVETSKGRVFLRKISGLKSYYQSIDFKSLMSIIETDIKHPVPLTLIYKAYLAPVPILIQKRNVKTVVSWCVTRENCV